MLTLITGGPGTGKTAWTVQELTRLPSQRKLYVHGIPELKIAHEKIYCLSDQCDHCRDMTHLVDYEDSEHGQYQQLEELENPGQPVYLVEEWQHWATFGSLIVIDEVQRVWRPSNKVPDDVAGLETHRHKGLDFWLISQGPHLFHSNVRLLITRHIHLVADWKGRKEFEFPECRQNVTNRSDAVERPYKLPKKIFGLYKSSTLHIKQSHRKPLSFYFMCASIAVFFVLLGFAAKRWNARQHPDTAAAGEARAKAVAPPAAAVSGAACSTCETCRLSRLQAADRRRSRIGPGLCRTEQGSECSPHFQLRENARLVPLLCRAWGGLSHEPRLL
jgi:zona occludens toxin